MRATQAWRPVGFLPNLLFHADMYWPIRAASITDLQASPSEAWTDPAAIIEHIHDWLPCKSAGARYDFLAGEDRSQAHPVKRVKIAWLLGGNRRRCHC